MLLELYSKNGVECYIVQCLLSEMNKSINSINNIKIGDTFKIIFRNEEGYVEAKIIDKNDLRIKKTL